MLPWSHFLSGLVFGLVARSPQNGFFGKATMGCRHSEPGQRKNHFTTSMTLCGSVFWWAEKLCEKLSLADGSALSTSWVQKTQQMFWPSHFSGTH